MERISNCIVNHMIANKLIENYEKEIYIYHLAMLIEKIVSYFVILILAVIFRSFVHTFFFLFFFSNIRNEGFFRPHFPFSYCNACVKCWILATPSRISASLKAYERRTQSSAPKDTPGTVATFSASNNTSANSMELVIGLPLYVLPYKSPTANIT